MTYLPHLAETINLAKFLIDEYNPAILSAKIDGVRTVFPEGYPIGRSLKPFKNSHVVASFTDERLKGIDGEFAYLPNPEGRIFREVSDFLQDPHKQLFRKTLCSETTGLLNSYNFVGKDSRAETLPHLFCFDLISSETVDIPYHIRLSKLSTLVESFNNSRIHIIPLIQIAYSKDSIRRAHREFTSIGFEWTVIRSSKGRHKNGRSTPTGGFLRLKDFEADTAEILGIIETQENLNSPTINALGRTERSSHKENKAGKGEIGALKVKVLSGEFEGVLCTVAAGALTQAERRSFFNSPEEIIGRRCSFSFMPQGSQNTPRFAQFVKFI